MVNTEIFLGSGASLTKIPELDIHFPISTGAGTNISTITSSSDFSNNFSLLNNLYVGCILRRYNNSNVLQTGTHRISSNTATTLTFTPSATIASNDYFVIENYGAPCPAPKVSSGTNAFTAQVVTFTFTAIASAAKATYDNDSITFDSLASEGAGSGTLERIGFTVDGSYGGTSATVTVDIQDSDITSVADIIDATIAAINLAGKKVTCVRSGSTLVITNEFGGAISTTPTSSAASAISHSVTIAGATVANADAKRLLSDTWLGITESATFPTTEVEMKQSNLSLGGTRNWTYQYKGIETATGGSLGLVANHGSWLYYFFGRCTNVDIGNVSSSDGLSESAPAGAAPTNLRVAAISNATYIEYDSVTETGPVFHRSVGTVMTPYVNPASETVANYHIITSPSITGGKIQNAIEYTFAEQNGDLLPSFAVEQVMSKLPSANTYRTSTVDANEDINFVKIARGCRVNDISMTANANEELKMTINYNTSNVHSLDKTEAYDARRGVTDETAFYNFSSVPEFREPFFFSDGTFSVFGQSFLKIDSLTLNMNNTLVDKRFLGVGNKSIQESIPSQRTYEIQFTGHVTDNLLYNELLNSVENITQDIELVFTKSSGERITLKFKDYFISANNFPIAEDKGPIAVEATIMARNLEECKVRTHWLLQG